MFFEITDAHGTVKRDTFEITLAEPSGRWMGKGIGSIKSLQTVYQRNYRFPASGEYSISIQHGMRDEQLREFMMWVSGSKKFPKVGKNKLAKFEEMKGFSHVVQAPFNVLRNNDFHLKGNGRINSLKTKIQLFWNWVAGKGNIRLSLQRGIRKKTILGIDIKGARIWKGAKSVLEKELSNVGFLRTNIEIVNQFFAPDEVDEIWLTFPDPQMKKTSKRLTSSFFLNRYKQFLKKEGIIHLKTDSNFQYSYTSALVHLNKLEIIADTDNLYESDILNDTLRIKTFYEKQWLSRGITIKYLAFRLNDTVLREPEGVFEKDEYRSFGRSARDVRIEEN